MCFLKEVFKSALKMFLYIVGILSVACLCIIFMFVPVYLIKNISPWFGLVYPIYIIIISFIIGIIEAKAKAKY